MRLASKEVLKTGSKKAKVAILFSGGVDSMVTAAFAGWHIPFR